MGLVALETDCHAAFKWTSWAYLCGRPLRAADRGVRGNSFSSNPTSWTCAECIEAAKGPVQGRLWSEVTP